MRKKKSRKLKPRKEIGRSSNEGISMTQTFNARMKDSASEPVDVIIERSKIVHIQYHLRLILRPWDRSVGRSHFYVLSSQTSKRHRLGGRWISRSPALEVWGANRGANLEYEQLLRDRAKLYWNKFNNKNIIITKRPSQPTRPEAGGWLSESERRWEKPIFWVCRGMRGGAIVFKWTLCINGSWWFSNVIPAYKMIGPFFWIKSNLTEKEEAAVACYFHRLLLLTTSVPGRAKS